MNLDQIETKSFIMALFIRDDNERFLLGTGAYEFKDSQLHFAGNTIENDVVSIQGNDGYMLAGQVRRPNTQVFDGYIGDATTTKSEVEGFRRDFFAFFRKNHFYTVVYIMADGSAIQRRKGFLVDAPTVKELWQMYPEYHVGFNFEDINYYNYTENAQGEETYGKSADVGLAKAMYGGLIWEEDGITTVSGTGTNITLAGTIAGGAIESVEMYGDTTQQTYSGKNLYNATKASSTTNTVTSSADAGQLYVNGSTSTDFGIEFGYTSLPAGTYTLCLELVSGSITSTSTGGLFNFRGDNITLVSCPISNSTKKNSVQVNVSANTTNARIQLWCRTSETFTNAVVKYQLVSGSTADYDFEPYVGGTASPNPDYPQEVQTVTGRQVVTITDGGSESQEYEINLGKNLLDIMDETGTRGNNTVVASGQTVTVNTSGGSGTESAWYLNDCSIIQQYAASYSAARDYHLTTEGGTYTVTVYYENMPSGTGALHCYVYTNKQAKILNRNMVVDNKIVWTVTLEADEYIKSAMIYTAAANVFSNFKTRIQIEKGSTATTYAPYFTPIELCKIGDYQDYIYKSGEDWYVHKDISKVVLDGTQYVTQYTTAAANKYRFTCSVSGAANVSADVIVNMSDKFVGVTRGDTWDNKNGVYQLGGGIGFYWDAISAYTTAQVQTWLSTNNVTAYYPLATPTDTQITNSALISELEGLLSTTTYSGNTYITVSGDLASPLEVVAEALDGGGVEWDANGAVWEDGGGGATTVVTVDSIDSVYPVWTVTGKSVNPVLTNLTTAMSISYNGTIAQGQTLVVDLLNKTAKLNGTSVIQNISGSWVEFTPGNNQVSYTTDNSDAPDSTIEWQEIVG